MDSKAVFFVPIFRAMRPPGRAASLSDGQDMSCQHNVSAQNKNGDFPIQKIAVYFAENCKLYKCKTTETQNAVPSVLNEAMPPYFLAMACTEAVPMPVCGRLLERKPSPFR